MTDQATKPKTFDEAFQTLAMSPAEEAFLEAAKFAEASDGFTSKPAAAGGTPPGPPDDEDPDAIPEWVVFPEGFKIPPGKQLAFIRFRANWTDTPDKGDRHCIIWSLSDADSKLALKRVAGEASRTLSELAKASIRAIDGAKADWSGRPGRGNVERFWDEIGEKCRQQLQNFYIKTHSLTAEEQADFFTSCMHVRSSVAVGGG